MNQMNDRRVKMTKLLLQEALVELLLTKHISKISVTHLCQTADIHRSTFYTHYTDPYDLLHQIQTDVVNNIRHYMAQQTTDERSPVSKQKLIPLLEYGKKNADLISVLLSDHCDDVLENEIMRFVNLISLSHLNKVDDAMKDYVILFGVSGSMAMIKKWLQESTKVSAETLADLIIQLTEKGVGYYSKQSN
ncbi:TetR family transcriptional regulator [Halolactibacillus alkaliphilus]|uniref:TetR family transcriptional regulator n=1 Tax=Halolactibacillus alkaliphilus TaxID=442899 RepID=A0A511X423_9BACI|nr:TetR-like C-terminal domain-containing protein [Halolactibacillus alkaliphilus]GEN57698.1 TetR family transcriptional regulator [Halolactibacillus alkaliphilus]GGN74863.1 TetR family transcriptional regulator [Halolactibacillus alkaliphilus]SFP03647.1 transcriptional regulator, TetR family [Halolactibacillus alkaliphilus]